MKIFKTSHYQITEFYRHFIREQVVPGDICIDATCGNGNDTQLFCELVGDEGTVFAFDIQSSAVENTRLRLFDENLLHRANLIEASHETMGQYVNQGSASCIVFNLGYLPSGDHGISTQAHSTLSALEAALSLLERSGLLVICIYSGGDTGFDERDAVLSFLKALNPKEFLVIRCDYFNRPNHPPIPILIYKL